MAQKGKLKGTGVQERRETQPMTLSLWKEDWGRSKA